MVAHIWEDGDPDEASRRGVAAKQADIARPAAFVLEA